jgi:flagellar motor switch/type III secretory pathway protein FliN
MKRHIERVELDAEVEIGSASALLRDVMALEPGDVLVLARECDEPIDLYVEGTPLAHGYPVQAGENYGFQVSRFYDQAEIVAGD